MKCGPILPLMQRFVNRVVFRSLARLLVAVVRVDQFRKGFFAQLVRLISVHVSERLIHLENRFPTVDQNRDAEPGLLEKPLPFFDLGPRFPPFTDIAEHQHHAEHLVVRVANWRTAIIDRRFPALLADQNGMIREPDNRTGPQHLFYWTFYQLPRLFVHNMKNFFDGYPLSLLPFPTGEALCNG